MKKISSILLIFTIVFFGFTSNVFAEELYTNVQLSPQTNSSNNVKLNVGKYSTTLIKSDHSLWVWGFDPFTGKNSETPTKEADGVSECLIEGYVYAMLKTDGSLYMWGSNQFGQIGDGVVIEHGSRGPNTYNGDYDIPYFKSPYKTMDNVKQVALGERHVLALTNDGTLYSWGDQSYGALGNGANTSVSNLPISTPIKIMDNVSQIAASIFNSAAIKSDGSLYMFGQNRYGSCGDGTAYNLSTPTQVLDNVKQVSLGNYHSAAVKKDGTLYMWGLSANNRLGKSTLDTEVKTPIEVIDGVSYVSLGYFHSGAIKKDNSLWMWGYNDHGGIGNGSTEAPSSPVEIMDNVAQVFLGFGHTAALKKDNSLWAWGHNGNGQLGNGKSGTGEYSSIPIEILKDINSLGETIKPDDPEPEEPTEKKFTVSITVNPVGAGTVTGAGSYAENTGVTLKATPNEGYKFVNWAENGQAFSTDPSFSFVVTKNRNIQACFKKINDEPDNPSNPQQPSGTSELKVYRLYNDENKEHLYTSDVTEYNSLPAHGWRQEGTGWNAPTSGEAVYRLYCDSTRAHLYTKDQNEINTLVASGNWTVDNNNQPLFYSGGSKNIFRLYNEAIKMHLLTTDENEYNSLGSQGWKQEGVALQALS